MKAIIKSGGKLLFLQGASAKNLEDLKDELILNFWEKWTYQEHIFNKNSHRLMIKTTKGFVLLGFSSPSFNSVELIQNEKDQLIFKLIK